MTWGWFVALVLYLLPVTQGVIEFRENEEDAKEWMRETGNWWPGLARTMAVIGIIGWPVFCAIELIWGRRDG